MVSQGFYLLRHPPLATPWSFLNLQLQVLVQSPVRKHSSWLPYCLCHQGHHHGFQSGPSSHILASVVPREHDVAVDDAYLCMLCESGHVLQAMALLSHIGTSLRNRTYIFLLRACIECTAPSYARQVYSHLIQHCDEISASLDDYLVVAFSKCGAIDDARRIFHAFLQRTVLSWTAIISALTDRGFSEDALQMFYFMQEDSVDPDTYTFVSLFKACGSINDLKQGKRLHALAHEKGFTSNVFVGNTLVSMYGKCGDVLAAEDAFTALPQRNIVSWNAMLSVFIEHGQIEHALLLYRQIHDEVMDPDQVVLVFALQACSHHAEDEDQRMSLQIGQALHALARSRGFESDMFVGTALINMYGKCGALHEAEHVFAVLPQHDIVTCNAMLSAYIQQGHEEKALWLYTQMNKEGYNPDECTYVYIFQAFGNFADKEAAFIVDGQSVCVKLLHIGQALHSDACKRGFNFNLDVANSLVRMYGKYGAAMDAQTVFSAMCDHDTMSWSMMLSVYVEQGRGRDALKSYRQMQEEGVSPDQHVLVLVLQACVALSQEELDVLTADGSSNKVNFLQFGQVLLADAHKKGVCTDAYVGNALINLYSKCVGVREAEDVFVSLPKRDVVAWTAMLSAYVEHGKAEKALQLHKLMHEERIPPNQLTFVIALHACGILMNSEKGSQPVRERLSKLKTLDIVHALHSDAHKAGFMTDAVVNNTFVALYGECGSIVEAESLFNNSSPLDFAAWTAMLAAYLECGQAEDVLCLYKEMQKQHVLLNDAALHSLFYACIDTANLEMCRELHFCATSASCIYNLSLSTTLIRAYGSCASMEEVEAVFDEFCWLDLVAWTACIAGNAGSGNSVASAEVLERSRLAGVKPDEVILSIFLLDCSNRGFVIEGLEYCLATRKDFGVKLNLRHYCVMIDLLGRAGDFKRIENVLKRMPMQADFPIWLTLLGACQIHGNVELAEWAFENAQLLEPTEASMYVTMSNICTGLGVAESVAEMDY